MGRWFAFGPAEHDEHQYRELHLRDDRRLIRLATGFAAFFILGYGVNDYRFFGLTPSFFALIGLRIAVVIFTIVAFEVLRCATSYRSYDRWAFAWTMVIILTNGVINYTRPAGHSPPAVIMLVLLFAFLVLVPTCLRNQIVLIVILCLVEWFVYTFRLDEPTYYGAAMVAAPYVATIAVAVPIAVYMHHLRRRLFQMVLHEREGRLELESLTENIPDAVVRFDTDVRFIHTNSAARKMFGLIPGESFGKRLDDVAGLRSIADRWSVEIGLVLHTGEPRTLDYDLPGDNGRVYHQTRFVPERDEEGAIVSVVTVTRDLTNMRRAEDATRESERKYRAIFDNAMEGIFQVHVDDRLLTVNPALAVMHGYGSPEEMVEDLKDSSKEFFVHDEDGIEYHRLLSEQGVVKAFEAEQYRRDGKTYWARMNVRFVPEDGRSPARYEGSVEDVTERKRLERELFRARQMEAIGTLAGGVAHDFNNLLTVITSLANVIKMSVDADDPLATYVDEILSASEKAASLVQSLLAFSRRQLMRLETRSVNDAVLRFARLVRNILPENIEISLDLSPEPTLARFDDVQMETVLLNLATNARDAMPHGGVFSIKTCVAELDGNFRRTHGFGEPGSYVFLSVSDDGMGMNAVTLSRAFEPFFTTKEFGKGTGLGLSSVYGIVKEHNGFITAESETGKGASFHVYLPLVSETDGHLFSSANDTEEDE